MKLKFREDMPPLSWGRPDSPRRALCSVCHAALPEVPLMMWDEEGACVQFCDDCVERWITAGES
jgi:hypothetical protein